MSYASRPARPPAARLPCPAKTSALGATKGIDQESHVAEPAAAGIDLLLLSPAVQHTVMARPWLKRRWTRVVSEPAERATFVLAASAALALVFWQWQPIGRSAWILPEPAAGAVRAVYAAGWPVGISFTFPISHFDLIGQRQARLHARGASYAEPGLYRQIRRSAPAMTVGQLLWAATASADLLADIAFKERDPIQDLGEIHTAYRAVVPALTPLGAALASPAGFW